MISIQFSKEQNLYEVFPILTAKMQKLEEI